MMTKGKITKFLLEMIPSVVFILFFVFYMYGMDGTESAILEIIVCALSAALFWFPVWLICIIVKRIIFGTEKKVYEKPEEEDFKQNNAKKEFDAACHKNDNKEINRENIRTEKYCTNCGNEIEEGSNFCGCCGQKLNNDN